MWSPFGGEGCSTSIEFGLRSIIGADAEVWLVGKKAKWSSSSLGGECLSAVAVPSAVSPKVWFSLPHTSDEAEVVSDDANSGCSSGTHEESWENS